MNTCIHDYSAIVISTRQINVINCSRVYNVFENTSILELKKL